VTGPASVPLAQDIKSESVLAVGVSRKEGLGGLLYSDGSLAVSGTNIYAAWMCYNHVLFTGSHDGGKTFANTTLLSTPNTNPKIVNDNVTISASGNNVAIMWDTNKTGIPNPVIRTSSDGGNTFGKIVTLNSTSGGINK